ncbi:5-(carboxyamino)imidazole ribonucleotide synthase [Palleronia sp. KMU-117]|uniref:5-(carboxyamino)imidazole ribonucleotide synthase n=1 Tax=Palleronia sp. KMU-117 TaxID=3434108 RepID=UPI003D7355ED
MTDPLPAGSVIGILGGGQLGRMLSVAAARLGYRCHIFDPDPAAPAAHVAHAVTTAGYDDHTALAAFADDVAVITYEFENIPAAALEILGASRPIRPGSRALSVSQDRLSEKTFLAGLGLATAPFAPAGDAAELAVAVAEIGTPSILKTRRFGYDGKGQARLATATDADAALAAMAGAPAILEGMIAFEREVSVIAARGLDGHVVSYEPGENVHEGGILRTTTLPARLSGAQRVEAAGIAAKILHALDYVGVIGVELFVTPDALLVNEFAPRVHNTGHWTQNACAVDQFEQHIRAVAGWPLGAPDRVADVTMENLIGADIERLPALAATPGAAIHAYGKAEARPGRKMGHVNHVTRLGS